MALLQNGYRDYSSGVRIAGATASNNAYPSALLANTFRTSTMRNMIGSEGMPSALVGVPWGARNSESWVMPTTAGALASRSTITGAGAASITLAGGVNGAASLAGSGDLTGTAALIVSLVATLSGSGTITSATAQAFLNLAASLAGSGDLDGAATALGHAATALSGAGTASATARATGELAASIVVTGTALNTANVGDAVWATLIEAGYSAAQIIRLVMAAAGGEVNGAPGGPIEVLGLDGSTVRLAGDVDADGNRTISVVDAD